MSAKIRVPRPGGRCPLCGKKVLAVVSEGGPRRPTTITIHHRDDALRDVCGYGPALCHMVRPRRGPLW